MTKDHVQPLFWRGAFTDEELDKALPPRGHWHEDAFSDSTQMLYLISLSPVAVELTAHDGKTWQHGFARMFYLDEGENLTAILRRLQQRAEMTDTVLLKHRRRFPPNL